MMDSYGTHKVVALAGKPCRVASLPDLAAEGFSIERLPYSVRILLENLLRREDGVTVRPEDIEALARWSRDDQGKREIAFTPARVLLQDFTGVPAVVDLAAMRDAMVRWNRDPRRVNPIFPSELVIDHSIQVDFFGQPDAWKQNARLEYHRNRERYAFLRWGQQAFQNFRVVPPGMGIVHQVNLEYLARVVVREAVDSAGQPSWTYPDTVLGTDSHTTMVNGLSVLGWGVGGIEAEAAMLGQPMSMLVPEVVGVRLWGRLPHGATATDLVLYLTHRLRQFGVVGKFVEFFGPALRGLSVADRATIANMAPEYGATCGFFPADELTLEYLRQTGRSEEHIALVEAYLRYQGLMYEPNREPSYTDVLEVDLSTIEPCCAGPTRPQDRVPLAEVPDSFDRWLRQTRRRSLTVTAASAARSGSASAAPGAMVAEAPIDPPRSISVLLDGQPVTLRDGSVVIAAITSCTNTSNPTVMLAAGLLAKKAVQRGLRTKLWVKTSLAPGSRVVTSYLERTGLLAYLEQLRFHLVGYGCTTCIGNSGPLPEAISRAIREAELVVAAVLSGNRNFEGRIHPEVRANYLASPPLVVAYALAGRIDIRWDEEPVGVDHAGNPVFLSDLWPTQEEIQEALRDALCPELFRAQYSKIFEGDELWNSLPAPAGDIYAWDPSSTYIRRAPFFDGVTPELPPVEDILGARALVVLGDSITTDHISPAGAIPVDSPAGRYLLEHGVPVHEFNTYGARRGNHEVMVRGTFANVRLRNRLIPGTEGGWTLHLPDGEKMTIFDAAMKYQQEGVPLLVLAGKEYGAGSSRDWAAKGPRLLGVRAVLAESFERIHRSNLVGMGIAPLQFLPGQSIESLGLTGWELFDIRGLQDVIYSRFRHRRTLKVTARRPDGSSIEFEMLVRIDTPREIDYYTHGGILPFVLRDLARG
jgi:aconitate hydratase